MPIMGRFVGPGIASKGFTSPGVEEVFCHLFPSENFNPTIPRVRGLTNVDFIIIARGTWTGSSAVKKFSSQMMINRQYDTWKGRWF